DADFAGVEVQGNAQRAVLELEQLVRHRRRQATDAGDAVAGLRHGADLFAAGSLGLVAGNDALERVPDLVRTDGKLRHHSSLILVRSKFSDGGGWWVSWPVGGERRPGD